MEDSKMETVKITLDQNQIASIMIAVNNELEKARKITDTEFQNESTRILMQKNLQKFYELNKKLGFVAGGLLNGKKTFNLMEAI
jgi:hypothetical protein